MRSVDWQVCGLSLSNSNISSDLERPRRSFRLLSTFVYAIFHTAVFQTRNHYAIAADDVDSFTSTCTIVTGSCSAERLALTATTERS